MRVFALYNIKGGVGKTASAVNLAYLSSTGGSVTLLWDLDPQGAASYCFRLQPKVKGGRKALMDKKTDVEDLVRSTAYPDLDLLPADFSYRNLDLSLSESKKPTRMFRKLLEPLAGEYDNVFLDCPPGISLMTENIFQAADVLLIPLIPTSLSLRTYEQIDGFLEREEIRHLRKLAFFTMADRRKKLHREVIDTLHGTERDVLATVIPYASDVERIAVEQKPLAAFAPRSASAVAYEALWNEVRARLAK
jgi:cellulose biosynthesis protein BcsQ